MEEAGEEEEGVLYVHCNRCQQSLSSFYKSSCGHCFCVDCATTHFAKDPCCPVCGLRLSQKHFRGPFDVGISAGEPVEAAMYKNVFTSNRLDEVLQKALLCLPAVEDVINLVTTQLYLENQRSQILREKVERKLRKARGDLKLTVQEARSKIAILSSQLTEAEAWKRKLNDELSTAKQEVYEVHRKNKSMEQMLARLRNDGHAIPAALPLPSPASTPPHQYQHLRQQPQRSQQQQQQYYPPPSPRISASSSKSPSGLQFPQQQLLHRPASAARTISPHHPGEGGGGGGDGGRGFQNSLVQPTPSRSMSAGSSNGSISLSRSLSPHHYHHHRGGGLAVGVGVGGTGACSPAGGRSSHASSSSPFGGRSFGAVSDYRVPY